MEPEFEDLLRRYRQGAATPGERALVEAWYAQWHAEDRVSLSEKALLESEQVMREVVMERVRGYGRVRRLWVRASVAAAVVIILGIGILKWASYQRPVTPSPVIAATHDALPGGNKAVLTLGNGSNIILDSATRGALARQGGATVVKKESGSLAYVGGRESSAAPTYNTLTTPRGGQYHLQLADGTVVWLNAASSIRYPTAFTGPTREVEVTGEAYLEVAKNPAKPFRVKANGVEIDVLGTSFDVNAYSDESAIRTTLVEGSVKVIGAASAKTLLPGQQAIVTNQVAIALDNHVNIEAVLAWKNGRFMFNDTPLPDVLRQLARWYDVDVDIQGDLSKKLVWGKMERDLNLSEVLEGLRYIGINYKIEGKKLTVMP